MDTPLDGRTEEGGRREAGREGGGMVENYCRDWYLDQIQELLKRLSGLAMMKINCVRCEQLQQSPSPRRMKLPFFLSDQV